VFGDRASDRDAELHALGGQLARLRKRHDERDWLLLGDFNRQPRAPGWKRLHAERFEFTLPGRVPTSLGKRGYASPYDHILVDARFTGELVGPSRRVDIVSAPCAGDIAVCRSQLSDHAPVVAVFRVDGPDDD
jgi:endonuclease/exonuclease/phosphatase family metal-dependent hydrolase